MTTTAIPDLRSAPLATLRAIDFRAPERDFWADEALLWQRFSASWSGLDDRAWVLPGAAPSDAGGPDWSLLDHVAHVADWQELALDYVGRAIGGGRWPADEDYDGGDFDTFNEARRAHWAALAPTVVRDRLAAGHERLAALVRTLPMETIRSDAAWGWVHMTLHGHTLDHLGVIEPWADRLRARQADGDPFGPDPRIGTGDETADAAAFRADGTAVFAALDEALSSVPDGSWVVGEVSPGWTVRDHVGHLADWFDECVRAIEAAGRTGTWPDDPEEGIDAWNARMVARAQGETPAETRARYRAARERLRSAAAGLSQAELRTPEAWSWVYDCLHGHARKHLALIGPFASRVGWTDG